MAKIYFSYSQKDKEYVTAVAKHVEEAGHDVIFDSNLLRPGDQFTDILYQAVNSADAVVIFWSDAAAASNWVSSEIGAAIASSKGEARRLVIPVVLDDRPVPSFIAGLLYIKAIDLKPVQVANSLAIAVAKYAIEQAAIAKEKTTQRERVKNTAAEYITKSLKILNDRERSYKNAAYSWYLIGLTSLVSSAVFGMLRASRNPHQVTDWLTFAQVAIFGAVAVTLLIGVAKYSFSLGKSFMMESLRNSDRRHAISFGEFYLNAFSEKSNWEEVKDVFQNWNIDKGSNFASQTVSDFDPRLLEIVAGVARAVAKSELKDAARGDQKEGAKDATA